MMWGSRRIPKERVTWLCAFAMMGVIRHVKESERVDINGVLQMQTAFLLIEADERRIKNSSHETLIPTMR